MKQTARRGIRRAAVLLLAVLILGGTSAVSAASPGSVFRRSRDYEGFADVSAGSWYFENVKAAYEYGLMVGRGAHEFDPDGEVTVAEGKFHQVKRMFAAAGHEVISLHRRAFGPLELDPELAGGQWRELTEEELAALRKAAGMTA